MKKLTSAMFIVLILTSTSMPVLAQEVPRVPDVIADVVIVRPVSLALMVLCGAVYVVSLPVAMTSKTVKPVTRALLVDPFKFTFERPVGDLRSMDLNSSAY
jgi:hypothetical protein